ncbi:MAG: CpsD/CapB family tyrosine-protein kinase [Planctomycetota bacterium]
MLWPFGNRRRAAKLADPAGIAGGQQLVVLVDDTVDKRLVVFHEPAGRQAEQYRGFRTNLRALNPGDQPRTLLFTSALPGVGKSISVANIALALAENEALKVCLVDADLRAGTLHALFGVPREPGLSDIMLDRLAPRAVLHTAAAGNLSILTCGRDADNPGEVLGSDYMQQLVGWLKQRNQYILFDAPPALVFADAAELSKFIDGIVLVVAIDDTSKQDAERALAQLDKAGANVVGCFVTGGLPEEVDTAEVHPAEADEVF